VGHADRESKGQRKKAGVLVEDMTKIFFAFTAHGFCGTVPSLNSLARELGKTQHLYVRAHLATTHSHTSK
jgi:hypothetical protein